MNITFIKARHRKVGSNPDRRDYIEIDGVVRDTTLGLQPGSAYALRDALGSALEDYERSLKEES